MGLNFPTLPLDAQRRELQQALDGGENLQALLDLCAHLADPTPLAWLCSRPGILDSHAELLAEQLILWPETSLLKVLKALPEGPGLERLLTAAIRLIPLDRLAVYAILDRNLKQHFPVSYEAYLKELEADWSSERALALLPARVLHRVPPELRPERARLARRSIEQLGRIPKAVSLSHAEELLSKRVYTQPGHFFFELLQNAEDARASTFQVRFEEDRIVVWHDGLPFDLRDLVGVTSIGQTTKQKQQIGFFGVGFKSVYEVTERPQIYSDVFCFEIIDVSIPRVIERPAEVNAEGTTLILPLKGPRPELAALARQLDPCVLLTLTHLRRIDLGDGWIIERQGNRVGQTSFLLDEKYHAYAGGGREAGRPEGTRVLVGLYLDAGGHPQPAPAGAPTIYSYLPTHQPSGLRFLIHGHFDVPVDRERINPDSEWNRWVLEQVPEALARLAIQADLLDVLPLPGEPQGPFAFLPRAIGAALQDIACLGGRRPAEVWLASPEMVALDLNLQLWAPGARHRQVAEQTLGCASFTVADLLDHLQEHSVTRFQELYALLYPELDSYKERLQGLAIVPDGEGRLRRTGALALAGPQLRRLYPPLRLVSEELESAATRAFLIRLGMRELGPEDLLADLEGGMPVADPDLALEVLGEASPAIKQRAARLALFLCRDGQRRSLAEDGALEGRRVEQRPPEIKGAVRAPSDQDLAAFYGELRPLLAHDYPDWPALQLDWPTLVADLVAGHFKELPHHLLERGYQQLPEVLLRQLAALPLWPDRALDKMMRAAHPEMRTLFPQVAFVADDLAELAHVKAMMPEAAGVKMVVEALTRSSRYWLVDQNAGLQFLSRHADEVSTGEANLLMTGELPDEQGRMVRVERLYRAAPALRALYRKPLQRSFLGEPAQRLLERLGLIERLPEAGPRELLEDVRKASLAPEHAREVLSYVGEHASKLSRSEAQQWLDQPIFLDRPLGGPELEHQGACLWWVEPGLEPLLREAGWRLLDSQFHPPARALMQAAGRECPGPLQILTLYRRLLTPKAGPIPDSHPLLKKEALCRLLIYLVECKERLAGLPDLLTLPIWPTRKGGRIAAWEVGNPAELEPFELGQGEELVDAAWESFLALDPLVKPRATVEVVRERLQRGAIDGHPLSRQPHFLSSLKKVAAVATLLEGTPLVVDGNGCLRLLRLPYCDLETLALLPQKAQVSSLQLPGLAPLPSDRVVEALAEMSDLSWLGDGARRARFYAWLQAREGEVFGNPQARRLLSHHPFWRTENNRLLSARELVLDERLPDLGVDWRPHSEMAPELRAILQRQLGVGTPAPEELLKNHLLPAYRQFATMGQRDRAAALLSYVAEALPQRFDLLGADFPVEDRKGRFRPANQVVWPDPELELELLVPDSLLSERYSPAEVRFLKNLGLAELPLLAELEAVFQRPRRTQTARALARLAAVLFKRGGPGFLAEVSGYRQQGWLNDALGAPRRPGELFLPGAEVESLIGTHGRFYPDPALADLLGEPLLQALGLRASSQVGIDEVLGHMRSCSQAGLGISFKVYQWLEAGVSEGRLRDLHARLGQLAWIYSDDGVWCNHRRVLGVHAFTLFGEHRGYWERGFLACPHLCRLFAIAGDISAETVVRFLEDIGAEVQRAGDGALLRREKALPRMLLACYARLAQAGGVIDRKLPVLLAQARPGREKRLLAAAHPALVSSDTPSLERLFESAGTFYVAMPGSLEQREEVEQFYAAMEVRSLRSAFTVSLDSGGQDCSAECADGIARLRGILRALLEVLPRVRRQRERLAAKGWVDGERLKNLAHSGSIRVIEGLKVAYHLAGVGTVKIESPGAYNPARGELLVDFKLAQSADAPLTGLAQGLVACLYQGPGEEQLVDILEILLPLGNRERMDAYLDARHFPAAEAVQRSDSDRLGERLGEILDYELDDRLASKFPELKERDAWREPGLLADCVGAAQAADKLLKKAGVSVPSSQLRQALQELFEAPALNRPAAGPRPTLPPALVSSPSPPSVSVASAPPEPTGLLSKLVNWVMTAGATMPQPSRPGLPGWAQANPYAPADSLGTHFELTRERLEQLAGEPPGSGLHHQPAKLPRPYSHAAHLLAGRFDSATQRWAPVSPAELKDFFPGQPTSKMITFQGNLAPGLSRLPLPFYTRLHGNLQVGGKARLTHGPLGEVRVECLTTVATRFQVEILAPPRLLAGDVSAPAEWLRPTHSEFPREVIEWLSSVAHLSSWERALAAQEFVQVNYAYDADYLEAPQVKRALAALTPGQGNHHLYLLHAQRSGRYLGHGMCNELNAMVCELLRHLKVPCLLASGWILDEGWVDRPDHTFAVAVLSSAQGPCLMPLDGANSVEGPLRPLGRRRPPVGNLVPAAPVAAPPGVWSAPGTLRPVGGLENLRASESSLLAEEVRWHTEALRLALSLVPPQVAGGFQDLFEETLPAQERLRRCSEALQGVLPSPEVAAALVRLMAGEYSALTSLPAPVEELIRLGLAQARSLPVFQVTPAFQAKGEE